MSSRTWPPGGGARRPISPRVAAPREPVDPARIGRGVVRRRAKGMDTGAVAAALEDARFDARQDSRHEHLADDDRGRAELAEWERLHQLLAAAAPGTVYDPDADDVVQAELAADAAAAAARKAELREAARIAARADELQALRELGTLEQAEPREGDEAVRDELTRRAAWVRPGRRRRLARLRPGRAPRALPRPGRPPEGRRPSDAAAARPRRAAHRTRAPRPGRRRRPVGVRGPAHHHRARSPCGDLAAFLACARSDAS